MSDMIPDDVTANCFAFRNNILHIEPHQSLPPKVLSSRTPQGDMNCRQAEG
jgi:hypothetical protein